jgi:glutamate-ammonia-ligase adenylyltransferase
LPALPSGSVALIGDTTEDGFVFRVDLALRPNGNSGPTVVSLAMLEEYLQIQGREWERFAWLKSRIVAPKASVAAGRAAPLRSLVTAFVYRRYLDYGVFEGLRQLHRKIREEAQRRAAGRPERANDVKLSRGGIREIEFIVQLMLVVRGGQFPEIRTRATLRGLQRLAERGLMKPEAATRLAAAYTFLRRVEHRIQYLDDQQTHLLPSGDDDLRWIAQSLGLVCRTRSLRAADRLGEVREFVAAEFDALLHDGQGSTANGARQPARVAAAARCPWTARPCSNGCLRCWPRGCAAGCSSRVCRPARREPAAPGPPDAQDRAGAARRWLQRGRRAALRGLGGTAAAPRELPGAAGGALRSACPSAACAGRWPAGRCNT